MKSDKKILAFKDRSDWRSWLDANHADASDIWLVIQKKHSPAPGLSLDDAVEEALCYGWIDSTLNTKDDQSYLLRFSPRKPGSVWSIRNIHRVEKLKAEGRMTEAGRTAVQVAKEGGEWQAAIDRENPEFIPPDLEEALNQDPDAGNAYRNLPDSIRKRYVYWLQSAKQKKTRQKRIGEIIKLIRERD